MADSPALDAITREALRLFQRKGKERGFEVRRVEVGMNFAARRRRLPKELFERLHRRSARDRAFEPASTPGIGGDVLPEHVAKGAPERLARVDLLLFEEAPAGERVLA